MQTNTWSFNTDLLAPREAEAVALVAEGKCNKAGAKAMGVQPSTFKKTLQRAMYKLNTYNRTETATVAIRKGIISALCLCLFVQQAFPASDNDALLRAPRIRTQSRTRRES